jgi:transposase
MCELNAIELAWAKVKHLIRENNTASDLSVKVLEENTGATESQVRLKTGQATAIMQYV